MKKILFAIIASIVLISCSTGNSSKDVVPDSDVTVVAMNPDTKATKVMAKLPSFKASFDSTSGSKNIAVKSLGFDDFHNSVQLTLIAGWGDSQEVNDGTTFVSSICGYDVAFTVSVDTENNIVKYKGLFPDSGGNVTITYYPSTDTFDVIYHVIYQLDCVSCLVDHAVMGQMYGAKIDGNFYSGKLIMYTFQNGVIPSTGFASTQVCGYKISINRIENSSNEAQAVTDETLQCVHYSDADIFPPEPVTYDAQFWTQMLTLNDRPVVANTDPDWLGKWFKGDQNVFRFEVSERVVDPIEDPIPEETPVVE